MKLNTALIFLFVVFLSQEMLGQYAFSTSQIDVRIDFLFKADSVVQVVKIKNRSDKFVYISLIKDGSFKMHNGNGDTNYLSTSIGVIRIPSSMPYPSQELTYLSVLREGDSVDYKLAIGGVNYCNTICHWLFSIDYVVSKHRRTFNASKYFRLINRFETSGNWLKPRCK
jgi:hypothetical protein